MANRLPDGFERVDDHLREQASRGGQAEFSGTVLERRAALRRVFGEVEEHVEKNGILQGRELGHQVSLVQRIDLLSFFDFSDSLEEAAVDSVISVLLEFQRQPSLDRIKRVHSRDRQKATHQSAQNFLYIVLYFLEECAVRWA